VTHETETAEAETVKAQRTSPELIDLANSLDDVYGASGVGGDASAQAS
jgi:hypothetical protein